MPVHFLEGPNGIYALQDGAYRQPYPSAKQTLSPGIKVLLKCCKQSASGSKGSSWGVESGRVMVDIAAKLMACPKLQGWKESQVHAVIELEVGGEGGISEV